MENILANEIDNFTNNENDKEFFEWIEFNDEVTQFIPNKMIKFSE